MNHERARNQETTASSQDLPAKATVPPSDNIGESSELFAIAVPNSQDSHNISWQDKIPFLGQHYGRYYFKNGLIWGAIVGLTAILSASFGVTLTKINAVEQTITQIINDSFGTTPATTNEVAVLDRPVNILLVEVEPSQSEMLKLPTTFQGESKAILLLKFDPQLNQVQALDIPPDSRVKIPGLGWGTVADAHRYGSVALLSRVVEALLEDVTIDRYVRATPTTFQKLLASGKIHPHSCHREDCNNPYRKVKQQQQIAETVRQRLNIPTYLRSFEQTFTKIQPDLDTNLSLLETMLIANYVKELPVSGVDVRVISGYTPAQQAIALKKPALADSSEQKYQKTSPNSGINTKVEPERHHQFFPQQIAIAVQNTTDNPELAIRFLTYLRQQNFQDVYLVEHIPLRLNKTKIITSQSQFAQAAYLKNFLGFGRLQSRGEGISQPLTIQIGEDAHHLPLSQGFNFSGHKSY